MPTKKTTALLDVDGTLIDSNDAHALSWMDTFAEFGYHPDAQLVRDLIGKGGDRLLPEAIGVEKASATGKEVTKRRSAIFKKTYLPHLRAFPQARELLERLRATGLKLVIATSAARDELDDLLRQAGIDDLVDDAVTASDADSSKPAPDIVIAALEAAGCAPREAVMLGDTPYDVAAARRAGVEVVALRCGGWTDADFTQAAAVYDDPHALLRELERSVFVT